MADEKDTIEMRIAKLEDHEACKIDGCKSFHETIRFNNEQSRSFLAAKVWFVGVALAIGILVVTTSLNVGRLLEKQSTMASEITVIKQELKESVLLKLPPNMSVAPPSGVTGSIPQGEVTQ